VVLEPIDAHFMGFSGTVLVSLSLSIYIHILLKKRSILVPTFELNLTLLTDIFY